MRIALIAATGHDAARRAQDIAADPARALHLTLMLEGARGVAFGDRAAVLGAGGLFLAASWRPHRLVAASRRYAGLKLTFDAGTAIRDVAEDPFAIGRSALAAPLRALMAAIAARLHAGRVLELAALAEAAALLTDAALRQPIGAPAGAEHSALADRALREIARDPGDDLTLATLAGRLGVSPRRLQRAFACRGETFSGVLRAARLARAKELLLSTRQPVERISEACGHGELSAFYRAFRRAYGCAPGALRGASADIA